MASAFQRICLGLLAVSGMAAKTCQTQGPTLLQHRRLMSKPAPGELQLPSTIFFDAVIRDFKEDHPDMQSMDGHTKGLVKPILGGDKKPIYGGGPQLSNKTNFDAWFNDVDGVNRRLDFQVDMRLTEEGTYVHEDDNFFPIDGKGWADSQIALDGQPHNFYFTLELHTTFVYQGGESFRFRGDDDVWVFINRNLVIDLGGVHDPMEQVVHLDDLNLTKGSAADLSFFFAERRCCGSKFRIETSLRPVTSTCTIWGDPHIDVFDNGLFGTKKTEPVSIYSSGDFWLVKNKDVKIQGRYGTTIYTTDARSSLLAMAIGGPFLKNKTLIIEQIDGGKVIWDGEEILKSFPSEFVLDGFMSLFFREGTDHIDTVLKGYPIKMIRALMPRNVMLTVHRWPKHIDAIIRMPPQKGGQDGHCGNFDFNATDDTQELIQVRTGAPVPIDELLFPSDPPDMGSGILAHDAQVKALSLSDCPPDVKAKAKRSCRKAGLKKRVFKSCVFDVCFGGKEFAAEDAILQEEEAHEEQE